MGRIRVFRAAAHSLLAASIAIIISGCGDDPVKPDGAGEPPVAGISLDAASDDLVDVWIGAAGDGIAVASNGQFLRFDGERWSTWRYDRGLSANAVWGSGPDDIFVVGGSAAIVQWNGSYWASSPPAPAGIYSDLEDIHGIGPGNIVAVGREGTVIRWDGASWSEEESGVVTNLYAVWGCAPDTCFAAGEGGEIIRWDGEKWSSMPGGGFRTITALWGRSGSDVWAVGPSLSSPLHWDGDSWKAATGIDGAGLRAVGGGPGALWAAGDDGRIVRHDGTSWEEIGAGLASGTRLTAIAGRPGGGAIVVGYGGALLDASGSAAALCLPRPPDDLFCVFGCSPRFIVAGGLRSHVLFRWNGMRWQTIETTGDNGFLRIWGARPDDLFAVGVDRRLYRGDGARWRLEPAGLDPAPVVHDVWGASADDVRAVGDGGLIVRWDGDSWTREESGTTESLRSIHGSGDCIYACGPNALLARRRGTWERISCAGAGGGSALRCLSPDEFLLVVGDEIRLYENGDCSGSFVCVGCEPAILFEDGDRRMWTAGTNGLLSRRDARGAWWTQPTGTGKALTGVWTAPGEGAWIVGRDRDGSSVVLRYRD